MSDTGTTPMLRAQRRRKEHGSGARLLRAVDWVDLDVAPRPPGRWSATRWWSSSIHQRNGQWR